jgi:predicted RNA-binding Zn-ribbon protein involved in translation (DUF1610 family)
MIERINGHSRFWRCPTCRTLLQKSMSNTFGPNTRISGAATCGACGTTFSQGDVYGGEYDLPEVKLQCPSCKAWLQGPGEELLGKPCPACKKILPTG